jgi:phage tail sheath protein FI
MGEAMPVLPTYPGVYIEELSSGVHTVTPVATSIAAFVGTFSQGPLDVALQVLSPQDFQRDYGGLDRFSETSYAVQQFFANGGQQAWIIRVADKTTSPPAAPARAKLNSGGATLVLNATAGRQVMGNLADDAGAWGNFLRLQVDYLTADPATLFNLAVSQVQVDGDRTSVLQTESYLNLLATPGAANDAVPVVNAGSLLIYLDRKTVGAGTTARPDPNGTFGDALPAFAPADLPAASDHLDIVIHGQAIGTITVANLPIDPAYTTANVHSYLDLRPFLENIIRSAAGNSAVPNGLKPLLANATVDLLGAGSGTAQHFLVRLGATSRPYDPTATITLTNAVAAAHAVRLDHTVFPTVLINAQQYTLSGGSDGPPPAAGELFRPVPESFFTGTLAAKTGMYALENVDLFNILCIPEATTMSATDMQALYSAAETYVESRRAMLIVDIPDIVNRIDLMQTWLTNNDSLRNTNAAVYFPRTNIPDPLNQNRPRSIASSGTIAGLWARTDVQRGVWKAPAGTAAQLQNVGSLTYLMTDQENGVLNPLGVNCLRTFPVYSNLCWGARTLEGADILASDWKYVPVRRLTLFLEESLYRGTKWVVFEPNDEPLWAQIRLNITSFMQDLFRQGAFQGSTPQAAYYVKCDHDTTTQQDIDNGIVNIEVGFAPLKPAEFVILQIRQIAPGATA